jgi:hypothetical protein
MKPIPPEIAERFSATLKRHAVPTALHGDYRKWLQYYLDFREKYPPPPARSEHVRLFAQKLREKKQPPDFLKQAAYALSLFFETEPREPHKPCKPRETANIHRSDNPSPNFVTSPHTPVQIIESLSDLATEVPQTGARYGEWRYLQPL